MAREGSVPVSLEPVPRVSVALCKGGGPGGLSNGVVRGRVAWSCKQDSGGGDQLYLL